MMNQISQTLHKLPHHTRSFTNSRITPTLSHSRHNNAIHTRLPSSKNTNTSTTSLITTDKPIQFTELVPLATILASTLINVDPSLAFEIHTEPSNALSLPTWMVHTSSVMEWSIAMALMWRYADAIGNPLWKGMAWGMLPCLGSAFCAVIYHFFYNSHDLDFLVTMQAGLTVVGNFTCWIAAYRIYKGSQTTST